MQLTLYQIDAFAEKVFEGNPAAVCPLEHWLPDELMQAIALENNLSETAFFVKTDSGYHIRWFTPSCEIALCGHATLASAYVIVNYLNDQSPVIVFECQSGALKVTQKDDRFEMDFPAQPPKPCEIPKQILKAFTQTPSACWQSEDYIVVFDSEQDVLNAQPDLNQLSQLDLRGVIITAPSKQYDFVNRVFAPKYGISEDPVTGSAFTQLIPYWADQLGKSSLSAKQVSQRGGEVYGQLLGDRVMISGKATLYMVATIKV